jgi:hypothetical protein
MLGHSRFTDIDSELEQWMPRSTPTRIRPAHLSDQIADVASCTGSALTGTAFPTPVEAESFTAPGDDCVRLYYADSGTPTLLEAGQPHPEDAISILQSRASTTLGTFENQKLMPECQNLGLQSNTRAQKTAQGGKQKA